MEGDGAQAQLHTCSTERVFRYIGPKATATSFAGGMNLSTKMRIGLLSLGESHRRLLVSRQEWRYEAEVGASGPPMVGDRKSVGSNLGGLENLLQTGCGSQDQRQLFQSTGGHCFGPSC